MKTLLDLLLALRRSGLRSRMPPTVPARARPLAWAAAIVVAMGVDAPAAAQTGARTAAPAMASPSASRTLPDAAAAARTTRASVSARAGAQGLDCMIQPSQIVQVGSPAAGVVERVEVERGEFVTRGQVLVQLQSHVERAALAVARERAAQQGEVDVAVSARALAVNDLTRANELLNEQFVSRAYVDRARAEASIAGGRSTQAEERRRLAEREVALAQAQLARRTVRAPIDGVVVDRQAQPGEYVEQKPMLRIAAIDPLRVDVLVPAAAFGRVSPGDRGLVVPELIDRSEHTAVVTTVDRVIDAASNTFRVRLELPNPGHRLPAGLRCTVSLDGVPSAPASDAAAGLVSPANAAGGVQGGDRGAVDQGARRDGRSS